MSKPLPDDDAATVLEAARDVLAGMTPLEATEAISKLLRLPSAFQHEHEFIRLAELLQVRATALLSDHERRDHMGLNAGRNLADAAIKARRAAAELANAREERADSHRLLAEYKRMKGHGTVEAATERPRLRRKGT